MNERMEKMIEMVFKVKFIANLALLASTSATDFISSPLVSFAIQTVKSECMLARQSTYLLLALYVRCSFCPNEGLC